MTYEFYLHKNIRRSNLRLVPNNPHLKCVCVAHPQGSSHLIYLPLRLQFSPKSALILFPGRRSSFQPCVMSPHIPEAVRLVAVRIPAVMEVLGALGDVTVGLVGTSVELGQAGVGVLGTVGFSVGTVVLSVGTVLFSVRTVLFSVGMVVL